MTISQQVNILRRQLAGKIESGHKQMALRRLRDCMFFNKKGLNHLALIRLSEARHHAQFVLEA